MVTALEELGNDTDPFMVKPEELKTIVNFFPFFNSLKKIQKFSTTFY